MREPAYRTHTSGVNKALATVDSKRDETLKTYHPADCQCGGCYEMREREKMNNNKQEQVEGSNE